MEWNPQTTSFTFLISPSLLPLTWSILICIPHEDTIVTDILEDQLLEKWEIVLFAISGNLGEDGLVNLKNNCEWYILDDFQVLKYM